MKEQYNNALFVHVRFFIDFFIIRQSKRVKIFRLMYFKNKKKLFSSEDSMNYFNLVILKLI